MSSKVYKNQFVVLPGEEVDASLENTNRQYLQGNLKNEQILPYIYSENSEIGISDYDDYCHDEPHYHDTITETNYIIRGKICLLNMETKEEFVIGPGGVFSVPPKIPHVLKIQPGTRIIFFKNDSKNDKHVLPFEGEELEKWFAKKDF